METTMGKFSASSPYEIARAYADGRISREKMVDELKDWPYDRRSKTDGFDGLATDPPGAHTFDEVGRAYDERLIDGDTYDEIQQGRRHKGSLPGES